MKRLFIGLLASASLFFSVSSLAVPIGSNQSDGSASLVLSNPNAAVPLASGQTNVQVTAPLGALGISPALLGGELVSADPLTLGFGVTGGMLDFGTLAGTIEHDGARISLTGDLGTVETDDDVTVELSDFLINTTTAILSGNVNDGGMTDLFSLDLAGLDAAAITDLDNPQIPLIFLAGASALLEDVFQLQTGVLSGVQFGLAATLPMPAMVSEPALFGLLITALVAIGVYRRKVY